MKSLTFTKASFVFQVLVQFWVCLRRSKQNHIKREDIAPCVIVSRQRQAALLCTAFLAVLLMPTSSHAVAISPGINLTRLYFDSYLDVYLPYVGIEGKLNDGVSDLAPTLDSLNFDRNSATSPVYNVQESWTSPHGAVSQGQAIGSFTSFATITHGEFTMFVASDFAYGATATSASYSCGTEAHPQTCVENGSASAGGSNNYSVYFSLLEPFAYTFDFTENYSYILFYGPGGGTVIRIDPDAGQSGYLSGILPAGNYSLGGASSRSVQSPTEGSQSGANYFSYTLTLTPVPEPETYAMLTVGLGLVGTMVIVRRRKQAEA